MDANALIERFDKNVAVGKAFGAPVEKDGSTVIPVAIVAGGGGGGGGGGGQSGAAQTGEGGGFGGIVYPIGVFVVREGEAKFVSSVNASRIAASVVPLMALMVSRALRRRKVGKLFAATRRRRVARLQSAVRPPFLGRPQHHRGEIFRLRRTTGPRPEGSEPSAD